MIKKTGINAHKEYLKKLQSKMMELNKKFENGTLCDYENDYMYSLAAKIKSKKQELSGFI